MIPQHGAKFLQPCLHSFLLVFHNNQCLVTLDIGGNGAGSHMRLKSKDTVPYIVIMRYLYLVKQDDIFKLCGISHYSTLSHNGISSDKGTVSYFCILVNNSRSVNTRCRCDGSTVCHPYMLFDLRIGILWKLCSKLQDKRTDLRQKLPWILCCLKQLCCDCFIQVIKITDFKFFHLFSFLCTSL